jgi:hypothetical protein
MLRYVTTVCLITSAVVMFETPIQFNDSSNLHWYWPHILAFCNRYLDLLLLLLL